jgi:hypothetical protein
MFDPPAGFIDLLADATRTPNDGELFTLEVNHVGSLSARKPMPRSAAALAMATTSTVPVAQQTLHFTTFVVEHVDADDYEQLCLQMAHGDIVEDAVRRIGRAIATWGTARPYSAVSTLCLFTGSSWRSLRRQITLAGIADPMTLPSLHALLDITEEVVVDGIFRSENAEDKAPSKGELAVRAFYDRIYAPEPADPLDADLAVAAAVPAGFETPEDVEAGFDAFLSGSR